MESTEDSWINSASHFNELHCKGTYYKQDTQCKNKIKTEYNALCKNPQGSEISLWAKQLNLNMGDTFSAQGETLNNDTGCKAHPYKQKGSLVT